MDPIIDTYLSKKDNLERIQTVRAVHELTRLLESKMKELGVSRTRLATLLGVTKPRVTQLLHSDKNKSIKTFATAFAKLGLELNFSCRPMAVKMQNVERLTKDFHIVVHHVPSTEPVNSLVRKEILQGISASEVEPLQVRRLATV